MIIYPAQTELIYNLFNYSNGINIVASHVSYPVNFIALGEARLYSA